MRVGLCGVTIVVMSENVRKLVGVVIMAAIVAVGVVATGGGEDDSDFMRNRALRSAGIRTSTEAGLESVQQCFKDAFRREEALRKMVPEEPLPVQKIRANLDEIRSRMETRENPDAVSKTAVKCVEMASAIIEENRRFTDRQPSRNERRLPADDSRSRDENRVPADESPSPDPEPPPPFVQPTVTALSFGSLPGSGTYSDPFVIVEHKALREAPHKIEWSISDPDNLVGDVGWWAPIFKAENGTVDSQYYSTLTCGIEQWGSGPPKPDDIPQQGTFTTTCSAYSGYGVKTLVPGDYLVALPLIGHTAEEVWDYTAYSVEHPWADLWLRVIPAVQPVIEPVSFGAFSGSGTEESPFQIPATEATKSHLYDLHWSISDPEEVVGALSGYSGWGYQLWVSLGDDFYDLSPMRFGCDDGYSVAGLIVNEHCSFYVSALTPGTYLVDFEPKALTQWEAWDGKLAVAKQPYGEAWFEVTGPSNLANLKAELATNPLITALEYGELSGAGTASDPFFLPAEKANWDWPRDITWQITDPDNIIGLLGSTATVHTVNDYGIAHNLGTYAKCDNPGYLASNPPANGETITAACKVFLEQGLHLFAFSLHSNTFNTPLYGEESHDSLLSAAKFWVLVG